MLLPVDCAGCGEPDRGLCGPCRALLSAPVRRVERPGVTGWAGVEYAGPVARAVRSFKDEGRTDVARALAVPLAAAVRAALAGVGPGDTTAGGIEVCTIPSTSAARRSRGYSPVELLLRRCGVRPAQVLRLERSRADQAGLGREARHANASGALGGVRRLDGRRFLLVDDVVTTGATLAEAGRAIRAAGGVVVAVAVLADTPLRHAGVDSKVP